MTSNRTLGIGNLIELLRSVDRLLNLEVKHGKAIEKLEVRIDELRDRVTRLETRQEIVIVEANDAARTAATQVAIASVSDMARRIGRLEERSEQKSLKPPE